MKIIELIPKIIKENSILQITTITQDCCNYSKTKQFNAPQNKLIFKFELDGVRELSKCAKMWIGIKDENNNYWSATVSNSEEVEVETLTYQLNEPDVTTVSEYLLSDLLEGKDNLFKSSIEDPFNVWPQIKVSNAFIIKNNIKISLYELAKDLYKTKATGTFKYNVNFELANNDIVNKNIQIKIDKVEPTVETPKIEKIKFNYAFFSPLYTDNFKPDCPVYCYVSENLQINKIEFYLNNKLINTYTKLVNPIILNISSGESFKTNSINVIFYTIDKTTGESLIFKDSKQINVSDKLAMNIDCQYNANKNIYEVSIQSDTDITNKISKILWQIGYNSEIEEHIISAGTEPLKMYTDVVFEDTTDSSKLKIDFDFKKAGKYFITAYVYDIVGQIHILKHTLETDYSNTNETLYTINEKIPVVINSSKATPVFELFHIVNGELYNDGAVVTTKLFENLYLGKFTVEYNDCVYIVKIGEQLKEFKIGKTNNIIIVNTKNSKQILPYVFKDFDGNIICQGNLKQSKDKSISFVELPVNKSGIAKIGDNLYKKID